MRKALFFLVCSFFVFSGTAGITGHVGEGFELTSIVFRLAGAPEYVNNHVPGYGENIDGYFEPYREHKAVGYARSLRQQYGVSYDAVMCAAALLEIKQGRVGIVPQCDVSLISNSDARWSEETFRLFVEYIDEFYRETKFGEFFKSHRELYDIATERMNTLLAGIDTQWIASLFSESDVDPIVIVSLSNGPNNYGFTTAGNDDRYGIVIGCGSDSEGLPAFGPRMDFIVVHEILHKFINPLVEKYWPQIEEPSGEIYSHVREQMSQLAYGNAKTTITEWLINQLSISYIKTHPHDYFSPSDLVARMVSGGFIWMERSDFLMDNFLADRKQYPRLELFMPQIVSFLKYTALHFDQVVNEYQNRQPYVSGVYPVTGSTICATTDKIVFRFSEPMVIGVEGVGEAGNDIEMLYYSRKPYWEDEFTYVFPLDTTELIPGKEHGIRLIKLWFQSKKGYKMKEDFLYTVIYEID